MDDAELLEDDLIHPSPLSRWQLARMIVWAVVTNIVIIALAVLAFGVTSSKFEALVIALLIVAIQRVKWNSVEITRSKIISDFETRGLLLGVYKKLLLEDTRAAEQAHVDAAAVFRRNTIVYYVNVCFAALLDLYLLWKVVQAVVL